MSDFPADWSALCVIVCVLGLRHGLDADHLATIDSMARVHARGQRRLASWCGTLFSLGHGVVVMLVAAAVGETRSLWHPPGWIDSAGAWFSIAVLVALGTVNLRAVLTTPRGECVAVVGVKGRFLGRWARARSPWAVAAVGALFALSFDTMSQVALFSATATQFGGLSHSIALGAIFVAGMLVTDGLNGLWISRLIRRADSLAARASRLMGGAVALASLGVAALGVTRQVSASVDRWADDRALLFGALTLALMSLGYMLARHMHRTPAVAAPS